MADKLGSMATTQSRDQSCLSQRNHARRLPSCSPRSTRLLLPVSSAAWVAAPECRCISMLAADKLVVCGAQRRWVSAGRASLSWARRAATMAVPTISSAACISQSANGSIISTRRSSETNPRQHPSTSYRCAGRVVRRHGRSAISRSGGRYLHDSEAGRSLLKRVTLRRDWDSRLDEKDQYPRLGARAAATFEAKPENAEKDSSKNGKAANKGVDNGKDRLSKVPISNIRNFSIIAHIDHGKSTLADKLLQTTGTVLAREMKEQFLDNMDLERERGITIKLQAARMRYVDDETGEAYCLNLIDTPGHVDFSYEVSRSLAACEGALLVVDASQGVEAQTLANVYLALESNLEIIPVLNKIDLPGADPERVRREIEEIIGLDCSEAILCSAKEGVGIPEILNAVVKKIPPPKDTAAEPLRALIFDSYYDSYRGVVVYFRVMDGRVKKGDYIQFMNSKTEYQVDEVGVLSPVQMPVNELYAGEVGYLSASIKSVADARVGDTITTVSRKAVQPLPGYQLATPMVFCGLFPIDADQFVELREALEKLQLNDAALQFEPETSSAMGFGFRCGFLGLLHMEIVQERLEREYNLDLITTAPSVVYRVHCTDGTITECSNPSALPDAGKRKSIEEPYVRIELLTPKDYIGPLMELAQDRRGEFKEMKFITESRASLVYMLPLGEMVGDFFDQLKSRSKGYASMEYSVKGYRESKLVKLDIRINDEAVDPLAVIVHQDKAYSVGRALTQQLKKLIPRQLFKIPIQACIGSKVIASENIAAMRKDVLAKCYGGDITRKKKLLKKQAEGKKRMKSLGRVDVPQDAFMAILRLEKEVV